MKKKILAGTTLAAVALGLTMAPATSQAVADVVGKGKVNFTQDLSTLPDNKLPGEGTGPDLTEPTQNPDPLALKIVSVTNVDFATHELSTDDQNKTYKALPFATTDQNGDPVKSAHFIRFQDIRTNTTTNYQKVSAKMTKQFANAAVSSTLTGATLKYKNISLVTGTNSTTLPSSAAVKGTEQTLAYDTAVDFLENKQVGKGFGVFEVMFDTNAKAAAGTYDGINLEVPGTNLLKTGDYEGEITWSIVDAN